MAVPEPDFERVPLPSLAPGELTADRLDPVLREWVSAAPFRALAEASGWPWPRTADTSELLNELARMSSDWDFRGRAGGAERPALGSGSAEVNGRQLPDDLVTAAATAIGLVTATPVPAERFSALAVLSGTVRACVNRTQRAADLVRDGVTADSVAVLGGHRELTGKEPALASELGFGDLWDEATAVLAATRQAFGLAEPLAAERSGPSHPAWDDALWAASASYRWAGVEVLIAPSADPTKRRANTVDQLRHWSERTGIGTGDRVLLLTTQIYVPYQQLAGLRVLGLARGCRVYCCGVDAAHSFLPAATFGARSYLQEIRSAVCAAADLLTDARRAQENLG